MSWWSLAPPILTKGLLLRMALLKNAALVLVLTVTCYVLETRKFTAISRTISQENYTVEVLPHFRGKRAVQTNQWLYIIDIEMNVSDMKTIQDFKSFVNSSSVPILLNNNTAITEIGITTVCLPTASGFQCKCEDQFAWPYQSCITYGACDNIVSGPCGCINSLPLDGTFCQPKSTLLSAVEYTIDVELNVTDLATVEKLKVLFGNMTFLLSLGSQVNVTEVGITTVCLPQLTGYQCRCEDQYRWSCDKCATYGHCSNITTDTCSCINAIPADGQFCQSVLQQNFTTCPPTTLPPMTTTVANTTAFTSQSSTANLTTTPILPVFYYLIEIEVNTTNVAALEQLRSILSSNIFPIIINNLIQITDVNISTVCYPVATGYQCRCEDQYRWSCDKCATYGHCSNITTDTCSCINAIPTDGQFCQSVLHQNFTTCPPTTLPPMSTTVANTTAFTSQSSTAKLTTTPILPVFYYLIEIEVNTTNVAALEQLRSILSSNIFPIIINNLIQITDVNISTVCYPVATGYQCRCEDQYRWSCDKCATYGHCSNITTDTCSCINAIPADGQFCQSVLQQNFTTCPPTTLPPMTTTVANTTAFTSQSSTANLTTTPILPVFYYLIDIEVNTTNVAALEQLRSILSSNIFPIIINNLIQITDVNISTVCYPVATGYQCRCEDQYRWSCDKCATYEHCSNITTDTCSCINAIPADGQFCQSVLQQNFTTCPPTTLPPMTTTDASTTDLTIQQNTTLTPTTQQTTTLTPTTQQNTTLTPTTQQNTTLTPTTQQNTTLTPTTQRNTTLTPTTQQNTTLTPTTQQNTTLTPTTQQNTTLTPTTQQNTTLTPTTQQNTTLTPTTLQTTTLKPTTQQNTTLTPTTQQNTTLTPTTQQNTTLTPTTQQNTTFTPTSQQTPATNSTTLAPTTISTKAITPISPTTPGTTLPPTTPGTNLPPTSGSVGNVWNMQFSLNRKFTDDLNDITSSAYNSLKSGIESKLQQQYGKTPGFVSATLKQFRSGSVIVDFEVVTTNTNLADIKSVESGLIAALAPDFIVQNGSFKITYKSPFPLPYTPKPMYPGPTLTLTCGPPPAFIVTGDLGVTWKVKGKDISGNPKFTRENNILKVENTRTSDTGLYECTLKGSSVDFHQTGNVTVEAPNVRAPTQINSKCEVGGITPLECCVQTPYEVQWIYKSTIVSDGFEEKDSYCVTYDFPMPETCENTETNIFCHVKSPSGYSVKTKLKIFTEDVTCNDAKFGDGGEGDVSEIQCGPKKNGYIIASCEGAVWVVKKNTCVLTVILNLQNNSESLQAEGVLDFVNDLQNAAEENQKDIEDSTATISTLVTILKNVASVSTNVSRPVMEGFLKTVNVLISEGAQGSWGQLNADSSGSTSNTSSILLGSLETITGALQGEPFVFNTSTMILTRTNFSQNSFSSEQSSSVGLHIPQINSSNNFINTIAFSTLNNVLPARNGRNQTVNGTIINGNVLLVKLNGTVRNVSLSFEKLNLNKSLANVQCVFWNFDLEGWDDEGCHLQSDNNETVTCNCNHLTSFSILMSPSNEGFNDEQQNVLDIITYIGVGISMGSLVVCLIIEACVWKSMTRNSTSYMRHVSIVNIAVSLLIADIWFIIGASISANPGEDKYNACSTATFFIHFFYLSLFFWMLISGLLLFYRTIMVFSHMSKSTMLAIGFSVGYGAPLIIAVVTVASTAPNDTYIRNDTEMACWLNWGSSKALLAFVIPALSIVLINFLILIVVLYKMLRRGVGDTAQPDEKNTLVVIARCLAILTPFFGLTWALGVGTLVDYTNFGTHVAFAFFNSLQGFFILVFGTLLDSKIRAAITRLFRGASGSSQGTGTRSTSAGPSSFSALDILRRMRRRNVYNVSEVANTSSSAATESFINI
ncbi:adhesion G protein-coupled receptor F5-like isoform X3 [Hypomesus transpacificus]|uniref:adhesion G protein-coupled receptor F5-like isoform X3 n=1 Tax=Hypomesus transpacificus TaxID=137520 RepID=UPI001F07E0EB|nr:adhesion G protein-coupled receptor F5-like isoform X3 [Hypomesus transpacificus]